MVETETNKLVAEAVSQQADAVTSIANDIPQLAQDDQAMANMAEIVDAIEHSASDIIKAMNKGFNSLAGGVSDRTVKESFTHIEKSLKEAVKAQQATNTSKSSASIETGKTSKQSESKRNKKDGSNTAKPSVSILTDVSPVINPVSGASKDNKAAKLEPGKNGTDKTSSKTPTTGNKKEQSSPAKPAEKVANNGRNRQRRKPVELVETTEQTYSTVQNDSANVTASEVTQAVEKMAEAISDTTTKEASNESRESSQSDRKQGVIEFNSSDFKRDEFGSLRHTSGREATTIEQKKFDRESQKQVEFNITDFKHDAAGRLRHSSGRYASASEQKQFDKQKNGEPADEGKPHKSVIAALLNLKGQATSAFTFSEEFKQAITEAREAIEESKAGTMAEKLNAKKTQVMEKLTFKEQREAFKAQLSELKNKAGEKAANAKTKISGVFKRNPEAVATNKLTKSLEQQHVITVAKLGEIKDSIDGINTQAAGGNGMFGELGDLLERRKGKRRGKGAGIGGAASEVAGDLMDVGDRRGGAYGDVGEISDSRHSRGGKAGKLSKFGKLGKFARGAGAIGSKLALPLTAAMALFDGFTGYNDTDAQKQTFNLGEGQEATFGQKMSMAAGSVLSLGGLTEMIGIDKGDIAKGIYGLFGGETKTPVKEAMEAEGITPPANAAATGEVPATVDPTSALAAGSAMTAGVLQARSMAVPDKAGDRLIAPEFAPVAAAAQNPGLSAVSATAGIPPAVAAAQSITASTVDNHTSVQDIEEVQTVNQMNKEHNKAKEGKATTIVNQDPEVRRLLSSIDKKIGDIKPGKEKTKVIPNPSKGIAVPTDFSDVKHRRLANDMG